MTIRSTISAISLFILLAGLSHHGGALSQTESNSAGQGSTNADATQQLIAALLGDTPMISDLQELTDTIGGRPTGSEANLRSVEWALAKFAEAGVSARQEPFRMPNLWLEQSAASTVSGDDVRFQPRVAAMPDSTAANGRSGALLDGGRGSESDFEALGERVRGAFVLIETDLLLDIPGLFAEYNIAASVESQAMAAGAAGVVYMGPRDRNVLNRHTASAGPDNKLSLLVMERDAAARALRLIRSGKELSLEITIKVTTGGPYDSYNVIGEIPGGQDPEEVVIVGAHLDSWGLGTGALDNGCNVAMLIDIARQMTKLGIVPRRTVRFALWNGEEQGLHGSWGYVQSHREELDRHVMAASFDTGSGRITGFITGGRPEIVAAVDRILGPVAGLGPFTQIDIPVVGTDNYDFMVEGIGNLIAEQESANYGPNYHARSDTFDRVDQEQLRLNAAISATVIMGFSEMEVTWGRQSREEVQHLIDSTDLDDQMKTFGKWDDWVSGKRGRRN